jgi:ribonuclease HI
VEVISEALGTTTNNVAEYIALLLALEAAETLRAVEVDLLLDSKLIVEQLHGRYRVRDPKLIPLHREAVARLGRFRRWSARHVPRSENKAADALANAALDRGAKPGERVRRWLPAGLFEDP